METFIVVFILILLLVLFYISIEVHVGRSIWKENDTDRPIIVLGYNEDGVIYKYADDIFERHMSLWDLLTKYTYEGKQ